MPIKKILTILLIASLVIPSVLYAGGLWIVGDMQVKGDVQILSGIAWAQPAAASGLIDKAEGGVITLSSGVSSNTATLNSSYDTTRSSIFFLGSDIDTNINVASSTVASLYLTNGTTVTATRGAPSTQSTLKVSYYIVQWSTGVTNSVQRGEIFMQNAATSNTATISSVTTSRSFVNSLGDNATTTSSIASVLSTDSLTNATTVTATRGVTTGGATSTYQVTEFNSGYTDLVQEYTITMNAVFDATATISSVTTGDSVLFFGGYRTNGGAFTNQFSTQELTNSTTVTSRKGSSGNSNIVVGTIVDFNSTYLNSNTQSGNVVVQDALTNTATISSVTTAKSLLSWGGTSVNNANAQRAMMYIDLTNSTTVTGTKGSSATGTATSTFMVLESK